MKTFRILVPTDFSPFSDEALKMAVSVAKSRADANVVLFHVDDSAVPGYDEELGVLEPEILRTKLQALAATQRHHMAVDSLVVHGQPADEILKKADAMRADLIVMGTHGRSGLLHLLLGSVTEKVLRNAKCAVLTVRCAKDDD